MKQVITVIALFFIHSILVAQSPLDAALPKKFDQLSVGLRLHHFPQRVLASTDPSQGEFKYFWKHTTSVLSENTDIEVMECGAYIFFNNQWNLRVSYEKSDFEKLFDCPKGILKKGQPYTFKDNWRTDNRLLGGWAMWYVIGKNKQGQKVYGIGKVETVGDLNRESINTTKYTLISNKSSMRWTGKSAFSSYSLSGNAIVKSGYLIKNAEQIQHLELIIDMQQLSCDNDMVTNHLKGNDFFEVTKYPTAKLVLVQGVGLKKKNLIEAEITIKRITKQLNIPIKSKKEGTGYWFSGKVMIDRTQFGVTYNSPSHHKRLKDQAIADEFELVFELFFEGEVKTN